MTFEERCKLVDNIYVEKQIDLGNITIERICKLPLNWKIDLYKFIDYGG